MIQTAATFQVGLQRISDWLAANARNLTYDVLILDIGDFATKGLGTAAVSEYLRRSPFYYFSRYYIEVQNLSQNKAVEVRACFKWILDSALL